MDLPVLPAAKSYFKIIAVPPSTAIHQLCDTDDLEAEEGEKDFVHNACGIGHCGHGCCVQRRCETYRQRREKDGESCRDTLCQYK